MVVDERREKVLTNYNAIKDVGRVIESDHNGTTLELNLEFSHIKSERIEFFQFKNHKSQLEFKRITSSTTDFSSCFENEHNFEMQSSNWRKTLDKYFHKAFKKVRISTKPSKKKCAISDLMDKRKRLQKHFPTEHDEEEIASIEFSIAEMCEEENRKNS